MDKLQRLEEIKDLSSEELLSMVLDLESDLKDANFYMGANSTLFDDLEHQTSRVQKLEAALRHIAHLGFPSVGTYEYFIRQIQLGAKNALGLESTSKGVE